MVLISWQLIIMGSWEEIAVRWTSLKILKLMETAVSVPAWEYFSLVSLLTLAWLYFVLDFHFLADLLCGLRGDPIRLFYNSKSKIPAQVLQQCRVLKERCISITFTGSSDQLIRAKQINFCCSLMWFCIMVGNCNLHCDHVWQFCSWFDSKFHS